MEENDPGRHPHEQLSLLDSGTPAPAPLGAAGHGLLIATFALWDKKAQRQLRAEGYVLWDITAKGSPGHPWAPEWGLVLGYKAGRISPEEYTEKYQAQVLAAGGLSEEFLNTHVFTQPRLGLGCFCRPGDFCHRRLIAGWLVEHTKKEAARKPPG